MNAGYGNLMLNGSEAVPFQSKLARWQLQHEKQRRHCLIATQAAASHRRRFAASALMTDAIRDEPQTPPPHSHTLRPSTLPTRTPNRRSGIGTRQASVRTSSAHATLTRPSLELYSTVVRHGASPHRARPAYSIVPHGTGPAAAPWHDALAPRRHDGRAADYKDRVTQAVQAVQTRRGRCLALVTTRHSARTPFLSRAGMPSHLSTADALCRTRPGTFVHVA